VFDSNGGESSFTLSEKPDFLKTAINDRGSLKDKGPKGEDSK
jgi:hypothetical protein